MDGSEFCCFYDKTILRWIMSRIGLKIPMETPVRIGMAIDLVVYRRKDAVAAETITDI